MALHIPQLLFCVIVTAHYPSNNSVGEIPCESFAMSALLEWCNSKAGVAPTDPLDCCHVLAPFHAFIPEQERLQCTVRTETEKKKLVNYKKIDSAKVK